MLEHGAGDCQGENSPRENCLNKASSQDSLLDTPGITSFPHADQEVRNAIGDELLAAGLYDEYWKWDCCQKRVIPFKCLDCQGEFYVPFRCDLRICPTCNQRYGGIFKARYLRTIRQLLKRKKGRDRLMFLTLTTKNIGAIPEKSEIQAHNKAIGKLITKPIKLENGKTIKFKGGVSVNEVKGTYLHSHCIVYGPFIPQKTLSKTWEALTGNKVVDIREIKQKSRDVVNHISKYIKKPYRMENNEQGHSLAISFLKNFKGVRRVHSFGLFYNLPGEKKPRWCCPFCESDMVIIDWDRLHDDWQLRDCKRGGIPSYKEVLQKWKNAGSNQWARA